MTENKRLLSLDTLRGFDMLFIMGLAPLIASVCALFPGEVSSAVAMQMEHAQWIGFRHHDTIFPLFLFIAGISFPFSFAKMTEGGMTKGRIYRKILLRGLILVCLGFVYNGFFRLDFETMRWPSVLARIGLAWMFAALLFINFKTTVRIGIVAAILVGYWLLLRFVPDPEAPVSAALFAPEYCLNGYIDRMLLPGQLYYGIYDPEGILSTVPAIATAMLGMMTGEFVRLPESRISGGRKTVLMLEAALGMLVAGLLWSLDFPIIKNIWSSSFVLVAGAYSLALFAIFYWIIDVKGWSGWTGFFKVVGMNSITIYMAQMIVDFRGIAGFFTGGLAGLCPANIGNVILGLGYIAAAWLFLYFLYKKRIFLKI